MNVKKLTLDFVSRKVYGASCSAVANISGCLRENGTFRPRSVDRGKERTYATGVRPRTPNSRDYEKSTR
jgi:hypothetical protein